MTERPFLDQINIVVRDMTAAADFYNLLGVEVESPGPPWAEHHRSVETSGGADLDLDSATFAAQWDKGWPAGKSGVVLGFRVVERSSVDELYTRLTGAGHLGAQEPYDAFWGARYALVQDPDGNTVGIMSAVDPSKRTRPPSPE